MNIFKWPSADGEKVNGKFACIIGQYMQNKNFKDFHQISELGVHSTTFGPELRNTFKFFSNPRGVHSTTFDPELRNEFKIFSNPGGVCPQTHIHHTDFISHALLGCAWLKI